MIASENTLNFYEQNSQIGNGKEPKFKHLE